MPTANSYQQNWYEESMRSREEAWATRFGPSSPPDQVFKPRNEQMEFTVPGFAFLRFPPGEGRDFWLYVTHGLAQPATFADFTEGFNGDLSGNGVEFAFATKEEEAWPLTMLERLSSYALSGTKPISPLDRIPASDLMEEKRGGHILVLSEPGYNNEIHSLSGTFFLFHMVGVTADEIAKAKEYEGAVGSKILELALRECGIGCVTDRGRNSITTRPNFASVWEACEKQAAVD